MSSKGRADAKELRVLRASNKPPALLNGTPKKGLQRQLPLWRGARLGSTLVWERIVSDSAKSKHVVAAFRDA